MGFLLPVRKRAALAGVGDGPMAAVLGLL